MLKGLMAICIVGLSGIAKAQPSGFDTVTVMTYNLLYYGANTSFCTTGNNNVFTKNGHFRTILQHVQPDILGVQEMSGNVGTTLGFLSDVLNANGETRWARANFMNTTTSNIVCLLYYDVNKFGISRQHPIVTPLRDIVYYRLYYKQIPPAGDTVFLNVAVMHLKAGSTAADVAQRGQETQAMMNYLNGLNLRENLLVMGDFNTGSSSEAGYSNMVNHSNPYIRLFDPVNRPGNWFNSSNFADIHTQSPRVTGDDCKSGGGLDDRYDQILINDFVRSDSARVRYVPGSYKVIGNDGQRFNGNLNTPTNLSAPAAVINALFEAADHLPVVVRLRINAGAGSSVREDMSDWLSIRVPGFAQQELMIQGEATTDELVHYELLDLRGQRLHQGEWELQRGRFTQILPLDGVVPGMYLLRLYTAAGQQQLFRFIRN